MQRGMMEERGSMDGLEGGGRQKEGIQHERGSMDGLQDGGRQKEGIQHERGSMDGLQDGGREKEGIKDVELRGYEEVEQCASEENNSTRAL